MKWIIILMSLTLLGLYVLGKKSVRSEVWIKASSEAVWKVLLGTDDYENWNPTFQVLEGSFQVNNKIKYQFHQDKDNSSVISARVKSLVPYTLINQTGGISAILTFNHKYKLMEEKGGTRVIIQEEYQGIAVPFWNPDPVEKAYQKLNKALKTRVENLN